MTEHPHTNGILQSAVRQAINKLAEKGVEGCDEKDIILASFGCMSLSGGLATSDEVMMLTREVRKFGWKIVGTCIATLVSIILVLIFL